MRLRLLLIIFFVPLLTFAQKMSRDSLREVIRTHKVDSARVDAMLILSEFMWNTDGDTSMLLLDQALGISDKMKHPERLYWLGRVNEIIANYYVYKGDAVKSFSHYAVSIACWDSLLVSGDPKKINTYNHHKTVVTGNLGQAYELQGDYPKALDCYFLALSMWEKLGSKRAMAAKMSTIAIVYDGLNDSARAMEYYNKSLALFLEVKDSSNIAKMYSNIGVLYFNEKNYTDALRFDSLALAMHTKKGNRRSVAVVLSNIGLVFQARGDYVTALDCFQRAIIIDKEVGNTRGEMIRLSNMGEAYTDLGQYKQAEVCLLRALQMADSLRNAAITQDLHLQLSILYKATGRFQLALTEYEIYSKFKDSLFNADRNREVARKEASYEFDKRTDSARVAQEKQKLVDDAARLIADENLKQTRIILFAFAGGFLLIGVLAFFIFRSYREKQRANIEISRQKAIIEQKNKDVVDSIVYAQRIQNALFASNELLSETIPDYFILFKPKDIVSGDFYYAKVKGQSLFFAACDSTGHGVPGAFMSLLNIAYLNEAINEQKLLSTDKILNHVRGRLIENISGGGQQDGMDGILVRFNLWAEQNLIEYSASYNAPFVVRNGFGESLQTDKMPVGASDTTASFALHKADLPKGSMLYLFTDGYADQFGGPKGKKMKGKLLEEKLVSVSTFNMGEQRLALEKFFDEWKGDQEQVDDVLVIGVRM